MAKHGCNLGLSPGHRAVRVWAWSPGTVPAPRAGPLGSGRLSPLAGCEAGDAGFPPKVGFLDTRVSSGAVGRALRSSGQSPVPRASGGGARRASAGSLQRARCCRGPGSAQGRVEPGNARPVSVAELRGRGPSPTQASPPAPGPWVLRGSERCPGPALSVWAEGCVSHRGAPQTGRGEEGVNGHRLRTWENGGQWPPPRLVLGRAVCTGEQLTGYP